MNSNPNSFAKRTPSISISGRLIDSKTIDVRKNRRGMRDVVILLFLKQYVVIFLKSYRYNVKTGFSLFVSGNIFSRSSQDGGALLLFFRISLSIVEVLDDDDDDVVALFKVDGFRVEPPRTLTIVGTKLKQHDDPHKTNQMARNKT